MNSFIHVVCIHMSALRDECICYQTYRAGTPSICCKYICVKLECFYAPALLWGGPVVLNMVEAQEAHYMVNEGLTRKLAETVTLTVSVPVYILCYCWVEMSVLHALLWMPTAMMYNYSRKKIFSVIHGIQLRVLSDFRGRSRG